MMSTLRDDSAAAQPERSAAGSAFRGEQPLSPYSYRGGRDMLLFENIRWQWVSHSMGLHLRSAIFCFLHFIIASIFARHSARDTLPLSPILC